MLKIFLITSMLFLQFFVHANTIFLEKLNLWYEISSYGPTNSDSIQNNILIYNSNKEFESEIKSVIGPIIISEENEQIFCANANGVMIEPKAECYDFKGNLLFSFEHFAYLRTAKKTEDSKLYILHYNKIKEGFIPINHIIILNKYGNVIYEDIFEQEKIIDFINEEINYKIKIKAAEIPG